MVVVLPALLLTLAVASRCVEQTGVHGQKTHGFSALKHQRRLLFLLLLYKML